MKAEHGSAVIMANCLVAAGERGPEYHRYRVRTLCEQLKAKCDVTVAHRTRARALLATALDAGGVSIAVLIALVADYVIRPIPSLV